MEIIARIKPLYDDLCKIGLVDFLQNNEWIRICNKLNLTDLYTVCYNNATANSKNDYSWLFDTAPYSDIFADFLNTLYGKGADAFFVIISDILIEYFPFCDLIPSARDIISDLRSIGISEELSQKIYNAWLKEDNNYFKKTTILKNITIARAIGGAYNEDYYQSIRSSLISNQELRPHVPYFIVENDTMYKFWQFIKSHLSTYKEREYFLSSEYEPLLAAASAASYHFAHHDLISSLTKEVNEEYIHQTWSKALVRMKDDPEGAITSARTLIEVVCKHILISTNTPFDESLELPKLYRLVASKLSLSPDQHTEQLFKQILGGCQTVIEGIGGLRNKLSDAHGRTSSRPRPSKRHSELAVNLSGSMCSFLIQTFEYQQNKNRPN